MTNSDLCRTGSGRLQKRNVNATFQERLNNYRDGGFADVAGTKCATLKSSSYELENTNELIILVEFTSCDIAGMS